MNTNYTDEYLSLIEDVAEDGELTYKEIRSLGKWLNDNKAGRKTWPANQFWALLKDVFADGKIDKSEARQVGRLIQKVRREWARKNTLSAENTSSPSIEDAISNFDPGTPRFPSIPTQLNVTSFSEPDVIYEIDFLGPTCSCPDFRTYRQHLPIGHISRCCKHLMQGYSEIRPTSGWPNWLETFLEAGFRPYPKQELEVYRAATGAFLVSSANPEWGNVYGDENAKYGYNIEQDRWSYGSEPDEAERLRNVIVRIS